MVKKILIPVFILVFLGLLFGGFLWSQNPTRQLKSTLKAFEEKKAEEIWTHMSPSFKPKKQLGIDELIQDLLIADTITTEVVSDEAWREDGEQIIPTPRYIASHYRAKVLFTLNGIPLEVMFTFQRQDATDEYHFSGFLFKPWIITNLKIL